MTLSDHEKKMLLDVKNALEDSCDCSYCEEHQQQACAGCACGYKTKKKDALRILDELIGKGA